MTLSTNVAVTFPEGKAPAAREVLNKAFDALIWAGGSWEPNLSESIFDPDRKHGPATTDHPKTNEPDESGETARVGSLLGQGFHAITDITYRPDGAPLYPAAVTRGELYPEDYDLDDPDEAKYAARMAYPACTYLLDFDTAYGCSFPPGVPATSAWSLHLIAISELNTWVVEQGGTVRFQDESTSEWHDCTEEGAKALMESGRAASDWFHNIVQPVIDAEVSASGGTINWH